MTTTTDNASTLRNHLSLRPDVADAVIATATDAAADYYLTGNAFTAMAPGNCTLYSLAVIRLPRDAANVHGGEALFAVLNMGECMVVNLVGMFSDGYLQNSMVKIGNADAEVLALFLTALSDRLDALGTP